MKGTNLRIGEGFDAHRFAPERELLLGGVRIPFERGLEGHSDADVLLHAVMNALLGALGEGDIGHHFPPGDERWKGISSMKLLDIVLKKVKKGGYSIINLDSTIITERPKLSPFISAMKERISRATGLEESRINIKAVTSEGLGFTGRGEGIAATCTVLLEERRDE